MSLGLESQKMLIRTNLSGKLYFFRHRVSEGSFQLGLAQVTLEVLVFVRYSRKPFVKTPAQLDLLCYITTVSDEGSWNPKKTKVATMQTSTR